MTINKIQWERSINNFKTLLDSIEILNEQFELKVAIDK